MAYRLEDIDLDTFALGWLRHISSEDASMRRLAERAEERDGGLGPYFMMANIGPAAVEPDATAEHLTLYAVLATFQNAGFPGRGEQSWAGPAAHLDAAFDYANSLGRRGVAHDLLSTVARRGRRERDAFLDGLLESSLGHDPARLAAHEQDMAHITSRDIRAAALLAPDLSIEDVLLAPRSVGCMAKRPVRRSGNPANRPPAATTTKIEQAVLSWGEQVMKQGGLSARELAFVAALWVSALKPDVRGINHCVSSCVFAQQALRAIGVEAVMVPVVARFRDSDRRVVAAVGSTSPQATSSGEWTGHTVLYLPAQGRILDLTIGQSNIYRTAAERVPLIGRVQLSSHRDPMDGARPGSRWQVAQPPFVIEYTVLDAENGPAMLPRFDEQVAECERAFQRVEASFVARIGELRALSSN